MNRFLMIPLTALALTGCGAKPPLGGAADVTVMGGSQMPPPLAGDVSIASRPYLIGPYDKLKIEVYGLPDLAERVVQVDSGGRLAYPIIGTVDATGKTTAELADVIRAGLRRAYIRDPQVTVNLEQTVSQVVTVDGEVREPGLYPVLGQMTLMRAVATAKGLSQDADAQDVVVFRTVGGRRLAAAYNLGAIRRGAYADPEVYANDVVIVGRSSLPGFFRNLVAAAPLITTPLIVLLR